MTPDRHAKVKELFLKLHHAPASERDALLKDGCGNDADLRKEVERLLAVDTAPSTPADSPDGRSRPPSIAHGPARTELQGSHAPGEVIAGRYRIVSMLGLGGMGEVYRADDLTLKETIAIKFLPAAFQNDPEWLIRFRQEVRLAREVTHRNVCRVFDIGEGDGSCFITMEHVSGEDLASLLRRIGRLPGDKGLDVAQQICAGLQAAHDRGVLHRDLKPANILLDDRGIVRISDFGLAGVAGRVSRAEIRSGTPRYMAPEQLAGIEVTRQSDIYALGLVLYELFTGESPRSKLSDGAAATSAKETALVAPSEILPTIDREVERTIVACLKTQPADRPASALQVAAMLVGGDVLKMAQAMGHTLSPKSIAAASVKTKYSNVGLWSCIALFAVFMANLVLLAPRTRHARLLGSMRSPAALEERAREVTSMMGNVAALSYSDSGFIGEHELTTKIRADLSLPEPFRLRLRALPGPLFWLRYSSRPLIPERASSILAKGGRASLDDPAIDRSGTVTTVLDSGGRLVLFCDRRPVSKGHEPPSQDSALSTLAEAMGAKAGDYAPTASRLSFPTYGDEARAWSESAALEVPSSPGRIEALAHEGRPRFVIGWHEANETNALADEQLGVRRWIVDTWQTFLPLLLTPVALVLGLRQLRSHQSDRQGARRLALACFGLMLGEWLLAGAHTTAWASELVLAAQVVVASLGKATLILLCYLAVEPYVRRQWPQAIVSWSSLLEGEWKSPLVGRDVLIGCVVGGWWALALHLEGLIPERLGWSLRETIVAGSVAAGLERPLSSLASVVAYLKMSIYQGFLFLLTLVVLRLVLRRDWLASLAAFLMLAPLFVPRGAHVATSWVLLGLGCVGVALWVQTRFGLVTIITAGFVARLLFYFPPALGERSWYSDSIVLVLVLITALCLMGWFSARRGVSATRPHSRLPAAR